MNKQLESLLDSPTYKEYVSWRALGFRAVSAYLIVKMGFLEFTVEYFS